MSYDEYPELWEEAAETAEECSECKVRDLKVPKGSSKHYQFCQEHHWHFYREYMIKRSKGEEGKDDFNSEKLVEGLNEKYDVEFKTPEKDYTSDNLEDLTAELVSKMDKDTTPFNSSAVKDLRRISEDHPSLLVPHADQILEKYFGADWSTATDSIFSITIPEILANIGKIQPEMVDKIGKMAKGTNRREKEAALQAFKKIAREDEELMFSQICERNWSLLTKFLPFYSVKKITPFDIVTDQLDFQAEEGTHPEIRTKSVQDSAASILGTLAEKYPDKVSPYIDEIVEFDQEDGRIYSSIIYLTRIGNKNPEKVKKYADKVENYLGYTTQSTDGELRTLSGAAAIFFLRTGLEQSKFSREELLDETRKLIDPSKYGENNRIEAIKCLGEKGSEEDIELIEFFKTEYSSKEFREAVAKSVKRIKDRK